MYGTVGRVRAKPGAAQAIVELMREWDEKMAPKVDGAVGGLLFQSDDDPNQLTLVAVFRDQKSYVANSDNPEQDAWFQKMAKNFAGEPSWSDGEIIYAAPNFSG